MEVIGILLILSSLVFTTWYVTSERNHKGWIVAVCLLSIFAGAFLILNDRAIEITVKGVGSINAAAEQATSDAESIAKLKKRIENQSATIDIIAQKANESLKQVESIITPKIVAAEYKLKEIDHTLEEMRMRLRITQLADKAIAESSRKAFDELERISEQKEDTPLKVAALAEEGRVVNFWTYMRRATENLPLKKANGTVAKTDDFSTEELTKLLLDDERWDVRMQAAIWLAKRKEEKSVKALIESLKKESNIEVVRESLRSFERITGEKLGLLNHGKAIKYWNNNKEIIIGKIKK